MTFSCKAATVWSDNFDDGNYDGWVVWNGTFSAEDHTLKLLLGTPNYGIISHLSKVNNGTWSFDELIGEGLLVWLTYDPETDYGLVISSYFETPSVHIELYSVSPDETKVVGEYTFNSYQSISIWQHIDVTRNVDGRTCLYLNGTLCIDVVDHVDRKSWVFQLNQRRNSAIDNTVVSNTVDIQPPAPFYTQTWFLATVGAVIVVVAVATVFLLRRKK
jgi:hypothetical protein